ncbi:MAG: undecaprenyldiphospho-muramoylpentapeptide beta-N-acetylglucosaminyltransferase [Oceanicoccus sp.]|uniref:undecaprenyldiphospho-muramoylpentapeptide beta-N-acetylglucosaminyltransferase n=1 Tax=Oceanicoccus sp. TaxID=2691044 RepID=UPI0026067896|nr:undecaprenyldiphospho-muramoylpentapeptide beta-N-acetylglucosaminyltransferase [Oceanicoccus sp.]MCP3906658.1 undecaprenyldiphospho-muramoylpentapeptide beta-N-acetylglucosaminyltransferase [Oceanicoccus sp.]MDG1773183.1 undecaprenyldiphospho-muramoylpentapeptide beta-N-acetylglucosaminyltransferase [Oceanicoccus sp.]
MTESLPRSVLIMAGGTGGHVFPALAAAQCLREKGINVEWLGTSKGIEARLVPNADIPIHFINVSGLRGKNIISIIKSLSQLVGAVAAAIKVLIKLKPICVLGMGGFASGPGGLAAWLTGRPLVIHEQNAVAGTTNKTLAKIATKVLLGYPINLGGAKAQHIGNPVRSEIARLPAPEQRGVGNSGALRLLVLGGSLGAKPINELLLAALQGMTAEQRPQVWHQTGQAHCNGVIAAYQDKNIEVKAEAFIEDMAAAYQWADVVLCRAGALTVAELAAAGVASILVPLPHAIDDHQTANARWLADNNAGILMKQSTLTAGDLASLLMSLNGDSERLLAMSNAARELAKVDAAEQVANICLEVANG